jgi:hypothetical protein
MKLIQLNQSLQEEKEWSLWRHIKIIIAGRLFISINLIIRFIMKKEYKQVT